MNVEKKEKKDTVPKWSERKKIWIIYCEKYIYGKRFRFTPSFKKLSEAKVFLGFWLNLDDDKKDQILTKEINLKDAGWNGKHIKSFSRWGRRGKKVKCKKSKKHDKKQ